VDISRSDIVKYPIFKKQSEAMLANFWKPHEINLTKDHIDFKNELDDNERFIFTSNLKRQILLDSTQSMALSQALLPVCSDPMVKRCINYMEFQEEVHASAYEHIVRNVYNDPGEVFDEMKTIKEITDCGADIAKYYDSLIETIALYRLGMVNTYQVKTALWLCLHSINALEGIRFFKSFSDSFSFGNTGRMIGNANEIQLIAGDELLHQAFTTALLRTLPEDDEEFAQIAEGHVHHVEDIFYQTVKQELEWVDYVFQNGSLIGLNNEISKQYIEWIAAKRMRAVGLEYKGNVIRTNPLPWMNAWLNEGDVQKPPQETEITSYVQNVQADLSEDSFKDFEL
jgi:ribonucleoside-diphosphate reductase beta chain